jgi:hypothetical protein
VQIYGKIDGSNVLTRSQDDADFDPTDPLADGFAPFVRGDDGLWSISGVTIPVLPVYAAVNGSYIATRESRWDGFDLPSTLHEGFVPFDVPGADWLQIAAGGIVVVDPTATILANAKSAAKADIDSAAGNARASFPSAGALVDAEYYRAESDARAYAAGGYASVAPASVQSWADAKGWTPQQAADDIIDQADAWYGVLDLIRSVRLSSKAAIDGAASVAAVDAARYAALTAMSAIRPA